MKVYHVISNLSVGGAERQFINTLNGLGKIKNVSVKAVLLSSSPINNLESSLDDSIEIKQFKVRALFFPLYVIKLAIFFKREKVDVVHSHMYWPSLYSVLAAKLARVKLIVTSDHGIEPFRNKFMRMIDANVINKLENLRICVSSEILDDRSKYIDRNKAIVLANCTELSDSPKENYALLEHGTVSLVLVGRLISEKGIEVAVNAVKQLKDKKIKVKLNIIGEGPLKEDLAKLIMQYGLTDRVKLLGNRSDVPQLLKRADIFVMPSLTEGQPIALLEAMSLGMPILATSVGGIPSTARHEKESLLVRPERVNEFATSITRLIGSQQLRRKLGRAAYQRVGEKYSVNSYSDKLIDIYKRS
jgi:glycosyltransferase involved in cell wall biosynthesis